MARILICEPHSDVRSLLSFVVRRLGHDPVVSDGSYDQLVDIDAIVVEPGDHEARGLAAWVREHTPATAIVCTSIYPFWEEVAPLRPDAYLVKPFPLVQLEGALRSVLESRLVPAG